MDFGIEKQSILYLYCGREYSAYSKYAKNFQFEEFDYINNELFIKFIFVISN